MTIEDCKSLMSSPIYQQLLQDFCRRRPCGPKVKKALLEAFMRKIKEEKPNFFENYTDFDLRNIDFLQPVLWDLLSSELAKYFNGTKDDVDIPLRRGFLEHQYLMIVGSKGSDPLGDEMANLFSAWLLFQHRDWVKTLKTFAMHQGNLGFWKSDVEGFVKDFHASGLYEGCFSDRSKGGSC